jgi:hypothetical protein
MRTNARSRYGVFLTGVAINRITAVQSDIATIHHGVLELLFKERRKDRQTCATFKHLVGERAQKHIICFSAVV